MPRLPVDPAALAWYESKFGLSFYSFDHGGCHFVVLNAQLMNSTLPEAESQRSWLERDLADHIEDRLFMFLHMPPYLWNPREPALGHYEIIDEPDRSWLAVLDDVASVVYPCRYGERREYVRELEKSLRVYLKSRRYLKRQGC